MKVPTGAILSKYLRSLALDAESMTPDGDVVTKAAKLAELVWKYALGFQELDPKTGKEHQTPPDWRAIELLYNRIEGKIPLAVVEDQGRSLTEKVSDLGKARINSLAKASAPTEAEPEEADDEA